MAKHFPLLILCLIILMAGALIVEMLRTNYARGEDELRWSRRLTKALYYLIIGSLILLFFLLEY